MLTLQAALAARRLGFTWAGSLSLGKALAGLNAQSTGRTLGIFSPTRRSPAPPFSTAVNIDVLTRAVILVAGMNLAEVERAAVLALVIADLTNPTTRIPE